MKYPSGRLAPTYYLNLSFEEKLQSYGASFCWWAIVFYPYDNLIIQNKYLYLHYIIIVVQKL